MLFHHKIRNEYEKTGFDTTQTLNRAGFGVLHDGSVDSIVRFISLSAFSFASRQEIADMVAFMLAFPARMCRRAARAIPTSCSAHEAGTLTQQQ